MLTKYHLAGTGSYCCSTRAAICPSENINKPKGDD